MVQGEVAELVRADRDERVRVKTTDDGKARAILSALAWVGEVGTTQDGALSVAAPVDRSGELVAAMSRSAVYVTEMAPVGRSLEQYFLEVTGSD